jgi:hypothetical protein
MRDGYYRPIVFPLFLRIRKPRTPATSEADIIPSLEYSSNGPFPNASDAINKDIVNPMPARQATPDN